jgi:predicted ester cyclase
MSKEANAAALSKFAEAVNTGKYELFSDVVASDCVDHDPSPGQAPGPDGYRALFTEMRQAFPDMKVDLQSLLPMKRLSRLRIHLLERKVAR